MTTPSPTRRHRRRLRAVSTLATLCLGAGVAAVAMPTVAGAAGAPQLERVLGYDSVQNQADDELRFDFIIRVPAGELPTKVMYADNMDGVLDTTAVQDGGPGMGEEYQIVSVASDGADDLVTITLRGNLAVPVNCASQPSVLNNHISVDVPSGNINIDGFPITWYANADCPGKQRPSVRIPWDNTWSSPDGNSQDGWGAIVTGNVLPANKAILDAENHNIGNPEDCGITKRVDYQWYRESGPGVFVPEGPMRTHFPAPHLNNVGYALELGSVSFSQPGYYKLMAWPAAQSSAGGANCATRTFTAGNLSDGYTVASVFNDFSPTAGTPAAHPVAWGSAAVAGIVLGGLAVRRRREDLQAEGEPLTFA